MITEGDILNVLSQHDPVIFISRVNKKYEFNWHHLALIDILDKFTTRRYGYANKIIIGQPPQTGKSEIVSRLMPAYWFGQNPDFKIGIASYASNLATGFNRAQQKIIQSDEYSGIFPDTRLNNKNVVTTIGYKKTSDEYEIVGHDGSMNTVGVGGPLSGKTLDIAIIDDPFKDRQEAYSKTIRDKVYYWKSSVFDTRLHNDSMQILMSTRWHDDDLAGRMIKEEGYYSESNPMGWLVCNFTGLKTDKLDRHNLANEYDRREIGEALWPKKHSRERYEDIKAKQPETWAAMYDQTPHVQGGNIITDEIIKVVHPIALPPKIWAEPFIYFADTSYTEKEQNDPNGLIKVKYYENALYIFDFIKIRKEATEALDWFESNIRADGQVGPLFIENKASGLTYAQLLRKRGLNAIDFKHEGGDKVSRLSFSKDYFLGGRVIFVEGKYLSDFTDVLKRFPNTAHDEEVDVLVMAILTTMVNNAAERDYIPR